MSLETMLDKLAKASMMVREAETQTMKADQAWHDAAVPCRYSQEGDDGLECAYTGEDSSDDPFCYSDNCPLLTK